MPKHVGYFQWKFRFYSSTQSHYSNTQFQWNVLFTCFRDEISFSLSLLTWSLIDFKYRSAQTISIIYSSSILFVWPFWVKHMFVHTVKFSSKNRSGKLFSFPSHYPMCITIEKHFELYKNDTMIISTLAWCLFRFESKNRKLFVIENETFPLNFAANVRWRRGRGGWKGTNTNIINTEKLFHFLGRHRSLFILIVDEDE